MPEDFPKRLAEVLDGHGILYVDDEVQSGVGRTGPVWAIERFGVEPDLLVSGKSLGGGLPLAAVTGRADVVDAVEPGGLGGTFGGNPVACAAAAVVLDEVSSPEFRARAEDVGEKARSALDGIAARCEQAGEVRGLGPMLALELVEDRASKAPAGALATATVAAARERGLVILSCGLYGNVVRLLVPLVVTDEDLTRGFEILEESLDAAAARPPYVPSGAGAFSSVCQSPKWFPSVSWQRQYQPICGTGPGSSASPPSSRTRSRGADVVDVGSTERCPGSRPAAASCTAPPWSSPVRVMWYSNGPGYAWNSQPKRPL